MEDLSLDESGIFGVPSLGTVQDLPKIDLAKLIEEDELQESMAVPFRFGYAVDVNYTVSNSGGSGGDLGGSREEDYASKRLHYLPLRGKKTHLVKQTYKIEANVLLF